MGAESESLAPFAGKEVQQGEEKEGGHPQTKPTFSLENECMSPEHQWLVQMYTPFSPLKIFWPIEDDPFLPIGDRPAVTFQGRFLLNLGRGYPASLEAVLELVSHCFGHKKRGLVCCI